MTTQEFSNSFSTLLNSYARKAAHGDSSAIQDIDLDEYEKSLFLTEAQEQLVLTYYNGKNSTFDAFEKTEEIRRYLSALVHTAEISPETNSDEIVLTEKSQIFSLPDDLWFITYEAARLENSSDKCISEKTIQVVPITQDDLHRVLENPFKGIGERRALRLDITDNKVELISKYNISEYIVRYVSKVNPIILVDLPDGLSIDGRFEARTCDLHEALHKTILELAVRLALQSKGIQIQ